MTTPDAVDARGAVIGLIGAGGTVNYNTFLAPSTAPVSWPVKVGLMPAVADQYQDRGFDLDAALESADGSDDESSVTLVSTGLGGTGKTQLASRYADQLWQRKELDLLVWITASSRDAVLSAYAAAAREVGLDLEGRDTEQAAVLLLTWLERTSRRWLIVLDDLTDPRDLDRLWPTGGTGRVLVTTRRRDAVLREQHRVVIEVDVFTPARRMTICVASSPRSRPTMSRVWVRTWGGCRWHWRRRLPTSRTIPG